MMEEIRQLISEGHTVSITVKGNSMNPFLVHLRDQITLGGWSDKDIKKGVTALVQDIHGNYVFHRIIRRKGDRLLLMGDGNIGQTETADMSGIIGIMHGITRKGREWTPKSLGWRLYSLLWMWLTPVRRYPLALYRKFFLRSNKPS